MMPQDPSERDRPNEEPEHALTPIEGSGEETLRWEEALYGLDLAAKNETGDPDEASDPSETEWFAEILDARGNLEQEGSEAHTDGEASLAADPALRQRFESYERTVQSLQSLGRSEAGDSGSPFLKARILAAIQEEKAPSDGGGKDRASPIRKRGLFAAILASSGVAAAALFGLLYLVEQGPRKESVALDDSLYRDDGGDDTDRGESSQRFDRMKTSEGAPGEGLAARPEGSLNGVKDGRLKGGKSAVGASEVQKENDDFAIGRGAKSDHAGADAKQSGASDDSKGSKGRFRHEANPPRAAEEVESKAKKSAEEKGLEVAAIGEIRRVLEDAERLAAGPSGTLQEGAPKGGGAYRGPADQVPAEPYPLDNKSPPQEARLFKAGSELRRRTSHGSTMLEKTGAAKVLLVAVEMNPQQFDSVQAEIKTFERQRFFFQLGLDGLRSEVGGGGGGGGKKRSVPSPMRSGLPSTGRPIPPSGGERAKTQDRAVDVSKSPGIGLKSSDSKNSGPKTGAPQAPEEDAEKEEAVEEEFAEDKLVKKSGWNGPVPPVQDLAVPSRGRVSSRRVSLRDFYDEDEQMMTSNSLDRAGDQVLVLKGPREELTATLALLFQRSLRHAIAYIPKASLTPLGARSFGQDPAAKRGAKNLDPRKRKANARLGNKDGQGLLDFEKSRKKSPKSEGDEGKKADSDDAESPALVGGTEAPGRKQGATKKMKGQMKGQMKAILEIRVMIRQARYPVPGRTGAPTSPAPGTPSSPGPSKSTPKRK